MIWELRETLSEIMDMWKVRRVLHLRYSLVHLWRMWKEYSEGYFAQFLIVDEWTINNFSKFLETGETMLDLPRDK